MTLILVPPISLLLVFTWTSEVPWHLYCALQTKASEIPLYHTFLWALQCCLCLCLCFMLLIIIKLESLHSLQWLLSRLSCILLIMNCLSIYSCAENIYIIWSKCVRESFFIALSFQLNCSRTRNKLSLGDMIRPKRIYFPKHFCYCFFSKLMWFGYN